MANILIFNASLGTRLANYLLDAIVIAILQFLVRYMILELNLGMISGAYLFNISINLCYYILMELLWGQTVGKMVTGTIVVTEDGEKPELRHVLIRTLCRYIPFEAFSFFRESGKGWHDSIAKTCVMSKSSWLIQREEGTLYDKINEISGGDNEDDTQRIM